MQRRFYTLDVFTDRPLAGNPLAVVLDCEGLDTATMQAIAREFALSETVFVFPAMASRHAAAVRIFTPEQELPFAGHPTIGTAVLLARLDYRGERIGDSVTLVLEEEIGPVTVVVRGLKDAAPVAEMTVPRMPARLPWTPDAAAVAAALGLVPEDIGLHGHALSVWSAGAAFAMVPVTDLAALARAKPPVPGDAAFGDASATGVFVYTEGRAEEDEHVRARMFAPVLGIPEDPATGSAAAAFAGCFARAEALADGEHLVSIGQGIEMGRPSMMVLRLTISGGHLVAATLAGQAVRVGEGQLSVDPIG